MRKTPLQNNGLSRPAFTLAELLIVIAIIVILVAISTSAYLGVYRDARERAAKSTLRALAGAVQAYYNENRDYPAMRFADIDSSPTLSSSFLPVNGLPNADQSMAALIYQLQYRSSTGDLLKNLPSSVLVPLNVTATDAGQVRQLYRVRDGWGNPLQYLRARPSGSISSASRVSASVLNNRVLLVSMGKDGQPGQEGTDSPTWADTDDGQTYPNPDVLKLGKGDDILEQVGSAQ